MFPTSTFETKLIFNSEPPLHVTMLCSISNERCSHPVVCKKTGHIYERSLIEKHLKLHKTCPITSDPMTMDDIVSIANPKLPSSPKPASTASIPSMLKSFHNEWDEVMLESYNLKKKLLDSRQQLSHSLYQYDAAVRVIARLTEERDRALQSVYALFLSLSLCFESPSPLSLLQAIGFPFHSQSVPVPFPLCSDSVPAAF